MAKGRLCEEWMSIPWPKGYEVSDQGQVRSLDRWIWQRDGTGKWYRRFMRGRILAPHIGRRHGYRTVKLGPRTTRIYCLVLLAFKGPPPDGLEGCHNNGKKLDDRLSNLRYDTHRNNNLDKIQHGTSTRGERHPMVKLTEEDVRAIRASQSPQIVLAARYGMSKQHISNIILRRSWAWLP